MRCSLVDWWRGRALAAALLVCVLAPAAGAQEKDKGKGVPSAAAAKEIVAILEARKLEAFAAPDPSEPGRFIAVLHVPGVQLLVVSAVYERATDIEWRIHNKDYRNAYADLRSGVMASKRMLIEDAFCDGLVAAPAKNQLIHDTVTGAAGRRDLDGLVADPKRKNDTRQPRDAYLRLVATFDEDYTRMLGLLVNGLQKAAPPLGIGSGLR